MNIDEARKLLDPTHTIVTDGTPEAEASLERARMEAERVLEAWEDMRNTPYGFGA
jgi:hypothetical protein